MLADESRILSDVKGAISIIQFKYWELDRSRYCKERNDDAISKTKKQHVCLYSLAEAQRPQRLFALSNGMIRRRFISATDEHGSNADGSDRYDIKKIERI